MPIDITIAKSTYDGAASMAAYHQVAAAVLQHDLPGFPVATQRMTYLMHKHDWPGNRAERYVAWRGGEPVGTLEISLPTLDNLTNASVEILVVPQHRRQGVGRALYDFAVERARANGRRKVMAHTAWTLPGLRAHDGGAGPAFAEAMGLGSANLPEVMRRFDLSTLDKANLDSILGKAKISSDGYRLVQWQDAAPEEYLDDISYLDSRLIEDAPMGDLAWEPEKVDADRTRALEKVLKARERRAYHTGAVHEETGSLVAWTTLVKEEHDWHGWQMITIVEPRHRGHRLGALVKVENLNFFLRHEPEVRVIDTFNAAENSYMISINEEMGFRPLFAFANWQGDLDPGKG